MSDELQGTTQENQVAGTPDAAKVEGKTETAKTPGLDASSQAEAEKGQGAPSLDLQGDEGGDSSEKEGDKPAIEKNVPEKYADFKLPEGFEALPELAESFSELARDLKLSQDSAQKAVDFFTEYQKQAQADFAARQDEFIETLKEQCMTDPEIGGAKWQGNAEVSVRLALEKLGTPELRKVIGENPALAVHPELVRFFKRAGDLLREGKTAGPRAGAESPSAAKVLFG